LGLVLLGYFNFLKSKNNSQLKSSASSSSAVLSSQADWQAGTTSNITAGAGGDIVINDKVSQLENISGASITADPSANKSNPIDGDTGTSWTGNAGTPSEWMIDLSNSKLRLVDINMANVRNYSTSQYSLDGASWTTLVCGSDGTTCSSGTGPGYDFASHFLQTFRYYKFHYDGDGVNGPSLREFTIHLPSSATHTTGATQISGGDSYWGWQTFTPTYTKPTNTNIQFRFRSSTDGSNWTGWSDAQTPNSGSSLDISALVTNRTGDTDNPTYYKYLQIETTLSSTDGVSTPTLDDYSIGYHTNAAPSKPTGLTAVIGN